MRKVWIVLISPLQSEKSKPNTQRLPDISKHSSAFVVKISFLLFAALLPAPYWWLQFLILWFISYFPQHFFIINIIIPPVCCCTSLSSQLTKSRFRVSQRARSSQLTDIISLLLFSDVWHLWLDCCQLCKQANTVELVANFSRQRIGRLRTSSVVVWGVLL